MVETFDDSERARRSGLRPEESPETWPVEPGMEVAGEDGQTIGVVKEVRRTDFRVSRRLHHDIYVPYSACQAIQGDKVTLKIPAGAVGDQGWAKAGGTGL